LVPADRLGQLFDGLSEFRQCLAQSDDRAHDHADAQNNGGHGTIRGESVQERLHDGVE
jgi:hypothetical protein